MKLVIAEKPSVAQSIAKVIGAEREDGYMEGNGYLVSWCVGHLVGLSASDQYDSRYSKWRLEDLPILPEPWQFSVSNNTKNQYDILKTLMHRSDVEQLIEATDAGREGELIFRLVYHQCECKKPFQRLWISSMEDSAIKKGFDHLFDSSKYDNLYQAALCRSKADWLVGINGTRLFSTLYNKTLNVGRVMTPTLALLTDREASISSFKKEKYYTILLDFTTFQATSEKIQDKKNADQIYTVVNGKPVIVEMVEQKEKTESPPKLYDLTTLQRDANRLFDYTAQQTLDYIQTLYEKKLCTYPRTDSRYLTEDMAGELPVLCNLIKNSFAFLNELVGNPIVNAEQVIDNSKVSDHHAILPTKQINGSALASLPTGEQNILQLIGIRLLCAVGETHNYAETALTLDCCGTAFSAKGRVTLTEGWKSLETAFTATRKEKREVNSDSALPNLTIGQQLKAEATLKEGSTSPPKRYTEDTLLSAMEHAGSTEFSEDTERKGLGTPATRAGVIEKLVKGNFIERKNKQLIPTEHGIKLISVMPDVLCSVSLTANWEHDLKRIEIGELSANEFINQITYMVSDFVNASSNTTIDRGLFQSYKVIGSCPRCGKQVLAIQCKNGKAGYVCEDRDCAFALWEDDSFVDDNTLTVNVTRLRRKLEEIGLSSYIKTKKGIGYMVE